MSGQGPRNWKLAPHQALRLADKERIDAVDLPDDWAPNRQQRRDYVRKNQTRNVRMHAVGWGRWRRHNESSEETWAAQTVITLVAPRRERRVHMIREAKTARWLRRQQWRKQTLPSVIKAAAKRIIGGAR